MKVSILSDDVQTEKGYIIYRLPGETEVCKAGFTAMADGFLRFGEDICVRPWPYISLDGSCGMTVPDSSTPREAYTRAVSKLVEKLKMRNGKTVICRIIAGEFPTPDVEEMARDYFSRFPDMLCFMFYHPLTGHWMGASPELLLQSDGDTLYTRALAGTRERASQESWSAKNLEEHRIVVDDIIASAEAVDGVSAVAGETSTFTYGALEHLCTPVILKSAGVVPVDRLVSSIHPTAAVCGFPRDIALEEINEIEKVPRNCYGGLISIRKGSRLWVYVILRCVHFDDSRWAVYTGSGVTADSDAGDEWIETQAKAEPLIDLLNKYNN